MSEEETHVVADLETTGLSSKNGHIILECAALHIDFKTLEVKGQFHALVNQEHWEPRPGDAKRSISTLMDDYVTKMHTDNGLLDSLKAGLPHTLKNQDELDKSFSAWLATCGLKPILCGNSISFDRRFMEDCTPTALKLCHYRMVDTSQMRQVYKNWCGEPPEHDTLVHRAMSDCYGSLGIMKWFRDIVVAGAAQPRQDRRCSQCGHIWAPDEHGCPKCR